MDQQLDADLLTGYSLLEARQRLREAGLAVMGEVEVMPPGDFCGSGELRVVKIEPLESGVRLYYSSRTYRRSRSDAEKP